MAHPARATDTIPAVGTTGSAGVLSGNNWQVCRADANTAWVTSGSGGAYDAIAACQSLGYATVTGFGGTCGDSCGYCGNAGAETYDGGGGSPSNLGFTVHWQCSGTFSNAGSVEEEAARFALTRAANLLRSQPDLTRLVNGPQSPVSVSVSSSGDTVDLKLSTESSAWATLRASVGDGDASDSRYVFGAVGQHWALTEGLTVGAMLQYDDARTDTAASSVKGKGWLAGPYFVGKLSALPLYLEGSLLWGRSSNTLTMAGAAPVDFGSDRSLATLKFSGMVPMGRVTLYPSIAFAHTSDRQEGFLDAGGTPVAPQDVWLTEARYGASFSMPLPQSDGRITLTGGAFGVYTQSGGTGTTTALSDAFDGSSLSANLGLDVTLASGGKLTFGAFADGLGSTDATSYGGSVQFVYRF